LDLLQNGGVLAARALQEAEPKRTQTNLSRREGPARAAARICSVKQHAHAPPPGICHACAKALAAPEPRPRRHLSECPARPADWRPSKICLSCRDGRTPSKPNLDTTVYAFDLQVRVYAFDPQVCLAGIRGAKLQPLRGHLDLEQAPLTVCVATSPGLQINKKY